MSLPRQSWYDTLPKCAAAMFRSIIANHPFFDGNKRIAVIAVNLFADLNGAVIDADFEDLLEFSLSVASGEPRATDLDRVTAWFDDHWSERPSV